MNAKIIFLANWVVLFLLMLSLRPAYAKAFSCEKPDAISEFEKLYKNIQVGAENYHKQKFLNEEQKTSDGERGVQLLIERYEGYIDTTGNEIEKLKGKKELLENSQRDLAGKIAASIENDPTSINSSRYTEGAVELTHLNAQISETQSKLESKSSLLEIAQSNLSKLRELSERIQLSKGSVEKTLFPREIGLHVLASFAGEEESMQSLRAAEYARRKGYDSVVNFSVEPKFDDQEICAQPNPQNAIGFWQVSAYSARKQIGTEDYVSGVTAIESEYDQYAREHSIRLKLHQTFGKKALLLSTRPRTYTNYSTRPVYEKTYPKFFTVIRVRRNKTNPVSEIEIDSSLQKYSEFLK